MEDANFSNINPSIILEALNYYKDDFSLMMVPTYIKESYNRKTSNNKRLLNHNNLTYVGSAEQSFIQLYEEGNISKGIYCAITPCHRDEPILDSTHLEIFLKIELIIIGSDSKEFIINKALNFFKKYSMNAYLESSGNRLDETDILINGIEVGSYGIII